MEINGRIQSTILLPQAFNITVEMVIENQTATAIFALETKTEEIEKILKVAGVNCWEQLDGAPIRLRVEKGEDGYTLNAVGHYMLDFWVDLPQNDGETEVAE